MSRKPKYTPDQLSDDCCGVIKIYKSNVSKSTVLCNIDKAGRAALQTDLITFSNQDFKIYPAGIDANNPRRIYGQGQFNFKWHRTPEEIIGDYEMVKDGDGFKLYRIGSESADNQ
jgi:hypothetical protein